MHGDQFSLSIEYDLSIYVNFYKEFEFYQEQYDGKVRKYAKMLFSKKFIAQNPIQ